MPSMKDTKTGHYEQWGKFIADAKPFYRNLSTIGGRNHLKYFQAISSVYEGGGVIELGCGRGTISQYMMAHYPEWPVVALDASSAALRKMREFFVAHGMRLPVTFEAMSHDVPVEDSVYSLVCSVGLLEHFQPDELDATLRECNRIVKPDGWNYHIVIYPTEEGPGMIQRYNVQPPVYAEISVPNQTTKPLPMADVPPIETPSYVEYWSWKGKCT